jgi:hypothetical protein
MIKYYPLNRVKTNLYTRGREFTLPNGKFYSGRYYLTYDGQAYAGINPVLGTNEPLVRVTPNESVSLPTSAYEVASTQNNQVSTKKSSLELTEIQPYYPVPTPTDYSRGSFLRYFAKTVSGPGYIIEISQEDFANLKNNTLPPGVLGYEFTSMLWQLTGPKNDVRVSQYQVKGGVETTNKRITEAKEKDFRGIIAFIGGDYTKFAKITP